MGETCTEEELGQGGGAPRRATPGTGVWSWWTRPSRGLLGPLPTSCGAWPTLQLRLRSGHQPPQARGPGRRRRAAGGTTRCTRPPLAPPGLRHALRPSAAAGAGELRGRAQRLRLQLRHPLRPGDLLAGSLGTPTTPGCCSLGCLRTAPAWARRLRPGELRARPPQASGHCDASRERARRFPGGPTLGCRAWEDLTSPRASYPTAGLPWPPLFVGSKA